MSEALATVREQLTPRTIPHPEILNQLMKKVNLVNFREKAGLDDEKKLQNCHFQIISIEHILELAIANQWGICRNHEFTYLYNGTYWSLCDSDELTSFLGNAAEKMGVDKFKAKHFNFRDQLYKQFIALSNLPKPEKMNESVQINLRNGTFEITPEGTKLKDFNPNDFITYQLTFEYDPERRAALFQTYLDKVLPDKQIQAILSEYLGYIFIQPSTLKLEKTLLNTPCKALLMKMAIIGQ
jgi:putative DNA primase/helicase